MRLLLDTHVVLWAALWPERLPGPASVLLTDPTNQLLFSVVCVWEVAIKRGLNRADFVVDPQQLRDDLLANEYTELPITGQHAVAVASLPLLHRDPFDRMMIAQALVEGVTFLTADPAMADYKAPIRMI